MKFIVLILSAVVGSAAMAFPNVGDKVRYAGTYQSGGAGGFDLWQEIEITAFDAAAQAYTVIRRSGSDMGDDPEMSFEASVQSLPTLADAKLTMSECGAENTYEELVRVKAGEFLACVVPQGKSKVWVSEVPFGVVKRVVVTPQNDVLTMELVSYQLGKQ